MSSKKNTQNIDVEEVKDKVRRAIEQATTNNEPVAVTILKNDVVKYQLRIIPLRGNVMFRFAVAIDNMALEAPISRANVDTSLEDIKTLFEMVDTSTLNKAIIVLRNVLPEFINTRRREYKEVE
ncbi:MAG: hypothetical protein QXT13_12645 [Pyrobaculum sp.]